MDLFPGSRRQRRTATALVLAGLLGLAACGNTRSTQVPPSAEPSLLPTVPGDTAASTPPLPTTPPPTAVPTLPPTATPVTTPDVAPAPTPRPSPRSTPSPTARLTARPTVTPSPTSPASVLVSHGSRSRSEIALTLDMGGRVGDALAIMDWLVDHGVHASIFMTGAMAANANTDAGRQVLGIVDERPDQFTLGNHSYTHRDFRTLTAAEIRDELRRTDAAIAPFCDQDPRPFFRPPSGGHDADVLAAIGAAGYRQTVMWDIDTIDWRPIANDPPGPTANQMVTKVLGKAQNGSIVLMHLGGYETFAALPRIVAGLESAGYDLVTLDEMLGG